MKIFRTKDGRTALIRPLERGDAAALLDMERWLVEQKEGMILSPHEVPEDEDEYTDALAPWLTGDQVAPCGVFFVGEIDDKVLGYVSARRHGLARIRHVVRLSIGVHPHAQGLGLGRALLEKCIAWAKSTSDDTRVRRIELNVMANNTRAQDLYQSVGFVHEGTSRGFWKDEQGLLQDDFAMGLLL